jgi:signal transduction histidine kinase
LSVNTVFSIHLPEKQNDNLHFSLDQLFQKNSIKLDKNWQFYWQEFIAPKDLKNKQPTDLVNLTSWTNYLDKNSENLPAFGYATYKLNFSIPKERPNTSLYIPRIIAAYKIWINGVFILETGRIGTSKENTLQRRFTKIIPLQPNETNFEVVIQVANFYNKKAGITEPILLGNNEDIVYKKSLQTMVDMFSIGSFSFVGIVFLVFYLLYWNKDQAVLYFSVMCIALSYHILNDRYAPLSKIFVEINWVFLAKTEYLATYVVGLCASFFFALILKKFVHSWYTKTVLYISILLTILLIILPGPAFTELVLPFLIFMMINIGYICFITIKAIIGKSNVSKLLLVNIIFATLIFLANIIFYIYENEIALIYVKFGYILVFLFISMLLLQRFSKSFHRLERANIIAYQQRQEIIAKSKELSQVNEKLAENLKLLKNNNEELDDFNHIVSHDLKTPLVSVYSLASFIEEDLKDKMDSNTETHLTLIKDVISKMEASINGLLEYSKVSKGSKYKELFSINNMLTNTIDLVDPKNKSTINLPKNDTNIYTNKIELEHVFQNLIGNSLKYNDKEKAIINISFDKKDNEFVFAVSDNGPGVENQYHNKIFKIFNQLDTNNDNSTGVGLAIVKKIISNNNGVIKVTSEKDKGLTILFSWKIEQNLS